MTQIERSLEVPPAPVERSVQARFDLVVPDVLWGATWAFACGALAAAPWSLDPVLIASAVAAWFVAVPLLGAVWAPASRRGVWGGRREASTLFALFLCLSVGLVLGGNVFAVVLAGVGVVAMCWVAARRPPHQVGVARSTLEIFVPALVGWFALGGPISPPAWMMVAEDTVEVALAWLQLNWTVPAVLAAFALVHHGATARTAARTGRRSRVEVAAGYVLAVTVLAVADRPLSAGAIALLFAVQWPFQLELERGRQHWYMRAAQWPTMIAMLLAAIGAGAGAGPDTPVGPG